MKPEVHAQLTDILLALERHLRDQSYWTDSAPSADLLASDTPFCVDTLSFPQWLQFVFLPRMGFILEAHLPLPLNSQIAPMAEEYFCGQNSANSQLCGVLLRFDQLIALAGNN